MPGAKPKGNFPMNAIARQPMIAAKAVEVNTAPPGIPSRALNIAGFTARMYDMVRNVVTPATISVLTVVCSGLNPNNFFNIIYLFYLLKTDLFNVSSI
jgi:hypothetical protein